MAIKVSNLEFSYYGEDITLKGISFSLKKGETLAVVGASGCGKSTLLRVISDILPDAKNNQIKGEAFIENLTPSKYRQTGKLDFMFQENALLPNRTVKQNINLPNEIQGASDERNVNDLLHTVGLGEFADYLPKQLSGGMKTRAALARSFAQEPELLLLDEPFSSLDIAWKSKLYNELEKLRERFNSTIILVTHDVQEALLLANKVIILGKNGQIIGEEIVNGEFSISERLSNISQFISSSIFQKLYSSIQRRIMNDANFNAERYYQKGKRFEKGEKELKDGIDIRKWLIYLVIFLVLFAAWEYYGSNNKTARLLLSSPSLVVNYFFDNLTVLLKATQITMIEAVIGLLIATIFSFGMMIICFYFPKFMDFILPIMITSQVVPLIVLAPFFIMLLGIGLWSKIAMAAIICFFPIFVNFAQGYKSISQNINELLHIRNASTWFRITRVYFPLSMPSILAGLKISATLAVIGAIVSEFNGAEIGLGKNLFLSAKRLEPELMMASLFLSTIIGFLFYGMIFLIEKLYGSWYN